MKLAPNFTLAELTHTSHADQLEANRNPPADVLAALGDLAQLLQRVRDHYDLPIKVNSSYRNPDLNVLVGGSPTSQHVVGEAADFVVIGGPTLTEVFDWVRLESGLHWGQIILEGSPPRWIHLSLGVPYRSAARCMQALTWAPGSGYTRIERDPIA